MNEVKELHYIPDFNVCDAFAVRLECAKSRYCNGLKNEVSYKCMQRDFQEIIVAECELIKLGALKPENMTV